MLRFVEILHSKSLRKILVFYIISYFQIIINSFCLSLAGRKFQKQKTAARNFEAVFCVIISVFLRFYVLKSNGKSELGKDRIMVGIKGSVGGLFGDYKGLKRQKNFGRKYEVYRSLSLCRVAEVVEGGDLFVP